MNILAINFPPLLALLILLCGSISTLVQVDDDAPAVLSEAAHERFDGGPTEQAARPVPQRFDDVRPNLSGPVQILDTDYFRIHYTLAGDDAVAAADEDGNGHPDYVDEVVQTMEHVRQQHETSGWAAPPGDGGVGGDARFDIYLHNVFEDGTAGYAESDDDTIVGDNANSPELELWAAYSYIGLDNDYAELDEWSDEDVTPLDFMRSTAAHEYNHAVQFGYDSEEPAEWLWEATATWMQDEIYDHVNDGNEDLYAAFKTPDTCQVAYSRYDIADDDNHWYSLWIYLRYISENHGAETVRAIWEQARQHDGYDALARALVQADTSAEEVLRNFAVALLTRNFEEGADYPLVRLEGVATPEEIFYPEDGVGQMAADFVEIVADDVVEVNLVTDFAEYEDDFSGILLGLDGQEASLFDMPAHQAVVDASAFDNLYLIVVNQLRVDSEDDCFLAGYSVAVNPAESGQAPAQTFSAPYFEPPQVEALDSLYDDEELAGFEEDNMDVPPNLLLDYTPPGYTLEEVYQLAADEFGLDDEELLWLVPGNGPATVVDYWGVADEEYISVMASDSPYPRLSAWLAAVEYEPWPEELHTIEGVKVLISDLGDSDEPFSNATLIMADQFISVDGTIPVEEMIKVAESFLAK